MKRILFVFLCVFSSVLLAEEKSSDFSFNAKLGVSHFTGGLGLEVQKGKWSLGVGVPGAVSLKRYQYENKDSLYYGVYLNRFNDNSYDDTKDGIYFDKYRFKEYGVGAGYIWLWPSGWNISTGLTLGNFETVYSNSQFKMTKTGIRLAFDLSAGYKF